MMRESDADSSFVFLAWMDQWMLSFHDLIPLSWVQEMMTRESEWEWARVSDFSREVGWEKKRERQVEEVLKDCNQDKSLYQVWLIHLQD